jgi:hypothetical protein
MQRKTVIPSEVSAANEAEGSLFDLEVFEERATDTILILLVIP